MKFDIGIIGITNHFSQILETLELMDEIDNIFLVDQDLDSVSYTHLTLPTSDLV